MQFTHLLCFAKGENVPRVGVQRKDESGTRDEVVDLGSTIPDVLERGEKPKGLRKGACCSPWHVLVFFFVGQDFLRRNKLDWDTGLESGTKNHHLNIKHRYPFPAIQKTKADEKCPIRCIIFQEIVSFPTIVKDVFCIFFRTPPFFQRLLFFTLKRPEPCENPRGENPSKTYMSNEKNPGCLGYIGDYTTQLYRDCNKPL